MTVTAVDERLLTPERLADLRAGAEKATPGEWTTRRSLMPHDLEYDFAISAPGAQCLSEAFGRAVNGDRLPAEANATHIANFSPSTAIALIDALEAARKEIAGLREGLEPFAALADDYIENDMDRDDTPMAGRMTGPLNGLTPIGAVVKFADFRRARNLIAGGNSNE